MPFFFGRFSVFWTVQLNQKKNQFERKQNSLSLQVHFFLSRQRVDFEKKIVLSKKIQTLQIILIILFQQILALLKDLASIFYLICWQ